MIPSNYSEHRSVRMQILSDDQIFEIIQAAKGVLERTGCKVLHEGAVKMLTEAGAIIDSSDPAKIKIPRFLVEESLRKAPKGIKIYDRDGNPALDLSGSNSYYGTSTASTNTKDALTGDIHPTGIQDIAMGAKVADALENIDWVMPFGSSQDVPAVSADLHEFEAVVTNTSKPMAFCGYSARGVELVFEMAAVVAGSPEKLRQKPFIIAYPEPITPLVYPEAVVERIFISADWGIPQIASGCAQMGATSPATLAGNLVQMVAEAMASNVLIQLRSPGAPAFFPATYTMFDMRSGLCSLATPECSLLLGAGTEISRYLGMPSWGLAGATESKCIDAQAGIEAAFSILAQGLSGLNLIHDPGYMDSGMICSAEMLVMGNEIVEMAKHFIQGISITPESLACDVIHKVGPGGNYLQEEHTFSHFKECWYPELGTRESYDSWEAKGKKDLAEKCHEKVLRIIKEHKPAPLSDKILEKLKTLKADGEKELVKAAEK